MRCRRARTTRSTRPTRRPTCAAALAQSRPAPSIGAMESHGHGYGEPRPCAPTLPLTSALALPLTRRHLFTSELGNADLTAEEVR